jgi:hypothetical protein
MMTQRVEEYEATCKETMDCVMEQFGTEAFMNMDANTFKLVQNMIKLANAGLQVTKAEAEMLDQIDSKLNDLNQRLLLINKIES